MKRIQITKHILSEWCEKNMNVHTDCETKWKRCVANYIDVGDVVVHFALCDKKFNNGVAKEVVEILSNLNK